MSSARIQTRVFGVLRWVVIAVAALASLFPFYYMLVLSVTPIDRLLIDPGAVWIDLTRLTFDTYAEVLAPVSDGGHGFLLFMRNSGLVALATAFVTIVVSIPAAYAVSRLHFFGRRQVSALLLTVYLFPVFLIAVPLFVGLSMIGLGSSLVGLGIAYVAQTLPVSILMLRSFFRTMPESVEEAAFVDGATRWKLFTRITVPLAAPTILSTGLYVFMIAWNEYLFALLFLSAKPELWTVSLGLSQLSDAVEVPTTVLMAGSVIITLPIVLLYALIERGLVDGLTSGAEKG
ncbi:MAG: carbohydrate ABC transporter permease [Protaetiibacter sp.]